MSRIEGCWPDAAAFRKFPSAANAVIVRLVALRQMPLNQAGFRHETFATPRAPSHVLRWFAAPSRGVIARLS
ncbi:MULTISPECIES: hypothetical protein [unclassified Bradyrhizobium]|uniref:hypothetical protein n=1 Tax=unclassified Bradyrhizobium TaxID=2631580 RepID=UPI0028E4DAB7|nr:MULTISPECIES: hypothetical protein [unclassified Bradyrhizobium]